MNVVHCPGCAQSLQLPENASPDMTLQCPHCGAVHQVDQFLPAGPDAVLEAVEPEVAFNEHAQEEFSQGETIADTPADAAVEEEQELGLLSFDDDIEELPMIELESDDDGSEELPSFEAAPVDADDEELPMIDLKSDDDGSEELPSFEAESIEMESTSETEAASADADDEELPTMELELDDDGSEELPSFEVEPIEMEAKPETETAPVADEDVADESLPMMELESGDNDSDALSIEAEPMDFKSEPELVIEPSSVAEASDEDQEEIVLPSVEFGSIEADEASSIAATEVEGEAAAELDETLDADEQELADSDEPVDVELDNAGTSLGFTEFGREPVAENVDDGEADDDLQVSEAASTDVPAAPKRSRVASLLVQIVCPECNDPVRMPESPAASDAEVSCPWCGQTNPLSVFAEQLAPPLQLVSPSSGSVGAVDRPSERIVAENAWSDENANAAAVVEPEGYESEAYAGYDDSPMTDAAGFDMSAHGLQPRARRRKKPSIIKMLVQWFGGGVLGIGGALAILYFGFPEKFPKFLPFQPPSSRSTSGVGSNSDFVPLGAEQNNDFGGTEFVVDNENSELLESIELPAAEGVAEDTVTEDETASAPETIEPEPAPSLGERRLQTAREALAVAIETEKESADFNVNRNSLYRGLAELAAAVADNPFSKQPKKEAAQLLEELGGQRELMMSLAGLAPHWLASSQRGSDGVFLVAKLGSKTKAQSRPGYHSIQLARYIGEAAGAEPITVFGLLDDLMPYQDQNVMILAVIENNASDITGAGSLLKLSAIQPL
ncbi:midas domain-containing protein [Rosistilla ulvae]|nr:hypothetical protein [Rosistilla ulvae]